MYTPSVNIQSVATDKKKIPYKSLALTNLCFHHIFALTMIFIIPLSNCLKTSNTAKFNYTYVYYVYKFR